MTDVIARAERIARARKRFEATTGLSLSSLLGARTDCDHWTLDGRTYPAAEIKRLQRLWYHRENILMGRSHG